MTNNQNNNNNNNNYNRNGNWRPRGGRGGFGGGGGRGGFGGGGGGGRGGNNNGGNRRPPWFGKNNWYQKKNNNKNSNNNNNNNNNNENNNNDNNSNNQNNNYNNYNNFNKRQNPNQFNPNRNFTSKRLYNQDKPDETDEIFEDESTSGLIFDSTARNDEDCLIEESSDCPFPMWNLYFPKEKFKENTETHQTVKIFSDLIEMLKDQFDINTIKAVGYFDFNYESLCLNEIISEKIADFPTQFENRPEFYLNCFGLAMHYFILTKFNNLYEKFTSKIVSEVNQMEIDFSRELASFGPNNQIPTIKARINNFRKLTKIKQLKSSMYEKFVSLNGTVVRVTNSKPLTKRLAFECKKCLSTFQIELNEGVYRAPTRCASRICNSKAFTPLHDNFMTKLIDWQKIKLQEVISDPKDVESGRIPRTIECELSEDLTGICMPGDLITINGIVKALNLELLGGGRSNREKCTFILYIKANSIQGKATSDVETSRNIEFTQKDLECFKEISTDQNAFKLIVNSLCPSIYGHELVKAGLILGLFGGSRYSQINDFSVRSDPHVLVVGDPGLGKSQLLRACANVSNRGVYVCGNSTTSAGLTVSLSKDSGDDFVLEAGALVCAHNGCCCIDEFDKMGSQQQTLLEVMEQQSISIAKGGIVCSLPCKTTVLAAANPCGGHYDKSKTVSENLKIGGPLLSRFDLLFILLDKPDEDLDYKLSSHIISLHSNKSNNKKSVKDYNDRTVMMKSNLNLTSSNLIGDPNENIPLIEKIKLNSDEMYDFDALPFQILRKYIIYAKRTCDPILSKESSEVLRSFYLHLRETNLRSNGANPITLRQIESLIRLTQARAKVELRKTCLRSDALEVIEIMRASMVDYYENELSLMELSQDSSMCGKSAGTSLKQFVSILQRTAEQKKGNLFNYDDIKILYEKNNFKIKKVNSIKDLIDLLNSQNFLLKSGPNLYKFSATNF